MSMSFVSALDKSSEPFAPLGDQVSSVSWDSPTAYGSNSFLTNTFDPKKAQNTWNSYENYKDRKFQEYMSNTAYQRQVEDMRKAGLNPYLAYSAGGASTPSGGTSHSAGSNSGVLGAISNTANTAISSAFKLAVDVLKLAFK